MKSTPEALQNSRLARAAEQWAAYGYRRVRTPDGVSWVVTSPKGAEYVVTREGCTCPDHDGRCRDLGISCKHREMVQRHYDAHYEEYRRQRAEQPAPLLVELAIRALLD
jgi:predicted nucleic acid-binding Zn finger protein